METKKQKIFYVITKSNWGGAQLYVYNLATNIPKVAFEPTVVAGGNGELFSRLSQASIRGISLTSLERDINFKNDLATYHELVALFRKERPDIVHLNSSKIGVLGALAARVSGVKKIIFTAHGWPFNEPRGFFWRLSIRFASYLTALLATRTIVIHQRDLEETRAWPFVRNKISLIHSGIGQNFYFNKTEAREKLSELIGKEKKFWNDKVVLGNVAELHRNKGLPYALEALKKLPENFIYIILGEGEERAALEKDVKRLGLANRVFLPGFVFNASSLVKTFDIFLFPSVKEGLSFTLLEAGLAGLPIVATNVGGTPDIITHAHSGLLVTSKSAAALESAILELHDNPELAKEYGKALHKQILTSFGLKRMLEETIALYKK